MPWVIVPLALWGHPLPLLSRGATAIVLVCAGASVIVLLVAASVATRTRHASPVSVGRTVRYAPSDVFDVCCTLAMAEAVLRGVGRRDEAGRAAAAFEVMEAGLAG